MGCFIGLILAFWYAICEALAELAIWLGKMLWAFCQWVRKNFGW